MANEEGTPEQFYDVVESILNYGNSYFIVIVFLTQYYLVT